MVSFQCISTRRDKCLSPFLSSSTDSGICHRLAWGWSSQNEFWSWNEISCNTDWESGIDTDTTPSEPSEDNASCFWVPNAMLEISACSLVKSPFPGSLVGNSDFGFQFLGPPLEAEFQFCSRFWRFQSDFCWIPLLKNWQIGIPILKFGILKKIRRNSVHLNLYQKKGWHHTYIYSMLVAAIPTSY